MDANGNLYGTADKGGIYIGVLYKLSKSGKPHSLSRNGVASFSTWPCGGDGRSPR